MQNLQAQERKIMGKQVKTLRKEGLLPAVIYGEGVSSQAISIPYREFEKVYGEAGESTLITLDVVGKPYNVLIHDVTYDPLSGNILHADFYAARMDKLIRTKVPIEFFGESPAVKNESGILVKVAQELEVEAFPQDLPHSLRADISALAVFKSKLSVKNILIPQGVRILADPEEIICLVEAPRSEEELGALEKAPEEIVAEVKTEQEIKKEMQEKEKIEEAA